MNIYQSYANWYSQQYDKLILLPRLGLMDCCRTLCTSVACESHKNFLQNEGYI